MNPIRKVNFALRLLAQGLTNREIALEELVLLRFANTPLFRGFWRGTERLYINALYMGQAVQDTTLPDITVPGRNEPERL